MSSPASQSSAATQLPDQSSHTYDALVARFVAEHPESLAIARENIARWLDRGVQAEQPLRIWDELLTAAQADSIGFQRLLEIMKGTTPDTRRLLEFSPFAGVLPRELRRQASDLCGYRH